MEKILGISRVTRKYQITLTKDIRELLDVKEGDKVIFIKKNGDVVIRKA